MNRSEISTPPPPPNIFIFYKTMHRFNVAICKLITNPCIQLLEVFEHMRNM